MFKNSELALIEELREQKAPLERWAKFFPEKTIRELMGSEQQKPIYYLYGKPVYASAINPCSEIPCDPAAYALLKRRAVSTCGTRFRTAI